MCVPSHTYFEAIELEFWLISWLFFVGWLGSSFHFLLFVKVLVCCLVGFLVSCLCGECKRHASCFLYHQMRSSLSEYCVQFHVARLLGSSLLFNDFSMLLLLLKDTEHQPAAKPELLTIRSLRHTSEKNGFEASMHRAGIVTGYLLLHDFFQAA